jgi:hypothetical protein
MITKSKICRLMVFLLVFLLPLLKCYAADSPFELDIRELEKNSAKTQPAPKKATGHGKTTGRSTTSYQKYRVRSGDTVFVILTRRFGLSDKRAENLIPEVLQVNNISRNTVLSIGRTLLFPANLKITHVSAKTQPVEPAPAMPAATQPVVAPAAVIPPVATTPARNNSTLPDYITEFWVKLLPGAEPAGTATPVSGNTSDADSYPWLPTADGGRIVIVPAGTLQSVVDQLAGKNKGSRIVAEDADRKRFLSVLLKATGFETVEENGEVSVGDDPKLTFSADFKIVGKSRDHKKSEVILLTDATGKNACIPTEINGILSRNGFRVVESCTGNRLSSPVTRIELKSITSRNQEEIVDSLLRALDVTASRSRYMVVPSGRKGSTMLGIMADRYFEKAGRRFIVKFIDKNPFDEGLLSLFEYERYSTIRIAKKDDFRMITGKILEQMNLRNGYDKYRFRADEGGRYTLELTGFLIDRDGDKMKRLCITELPVDDTTSRLVSGMRWEQQ